VYLLFDPVSLCSICSLYESESSSRYERNFDPATRRGTKEIKYWQEKSKLNELKGKEDILSMQKYRGVRWVKEWEIQK
jgi:hypothetical protein